MKKSNVMIMIGFTALCVMGWFSVGKQVISKTITEKKLVENSIEIADGWVERGLYQRAMGKYESVLEIENTQEVYEKLHKAYQLRYQEAPEETLEAYMEFLDRATADYPGNQTFVDDFVKIYQMEDRYEEIFYCLSNAIENGYNTSEIQEKYLQVRYGFDFRQSEFTKIEQPVQGIYTVKNNGKWDLYHLEEGYLLSQEYEYVSPCSEEGIFITTTEEDSRLVNDSGMVLGIFDFLVTEAGLFSEGLMPVRTTGGYSYFNEFAEEQFGGFEIAGCFQNGQAAVKKDGKWMFVNTKGEVISEIYEEIVLDEVGRYFFQDVIIAKSGDTYGFYNEKLELETTLDCVEIDQYTEDGLIAICKDGKWGFVNSKGELVIEPVFQEAKSFTYGLGAVCKDNQWGFIDPQGNVVIDYQFSEVGYMEENGVCPVKINQVEEGEEAETSETSEKWKFLELQLGIKED